MNTTITFPTPGPALKVVRPATEKWAATLDEERRRLQEDQEALRERETNLKEYEARLRALQTEIEANRTTPGGYPQTLSHPPMETQIPFHRPTSRSPFTEDPALHAAWEKLHRAHELFEAEQVHLRNDRIAIREQEAALKRREESVSAREQRIAEREAAFIAAAGRTAPAPVAPKAAAEPVSESVVSRITRAPFAVARSVFGKK